MFRLINVSFSLIILLLLSSTASMAAIKFKVGHQLSPVYPYYSFKVEHISSKNKNTAVTDTAAMSPLDQERLQLLMMST